MAGGLVEQAIKRLGKNLRTARLRRNLTIEDVAEKFGPGPRAVSDAEKGKLSPAYDLTPSMPVSLERRDLCHDSDHHHADDRVYTIKRSLI